MRLILPLSLALFFSSPISAQDTLLVGYKLAPPFVQQEGDRLYGPSVWLWQQIAAAHELPYKFVPLSLTGILDSLSDSTIDLCLSPLTITSDRSERMDFSPPYYIEEASIVAHRTSAADQAFQFIRSFFSLNFFRVLGGLVIVILIFGFLAWLFERKANAEEFGNGIRGLWNGFWWSAVTMTTVGYGDKSPRTFGGRIIALVWMFTAIIIISGFTAGIASSLTITSISTSSALIEDFKDRKLGTILNSGTNQWLRDNYYNKRQSFTDLESALEALREKRIDAIAHDKSLLKYLLKSDTTNHFQLLNIDFYPQFYAMGMRQDLPDELQETITVSLLDLTESREWQVLLAEYELK